MTVNRLPLVICIGFSLTCCGCGSDKGMRTTIFVSSEKELSQVSQKISEIEATKRIHGVDIVVAPGVYRVSLPIELSAADSGCPGGEVVLRSADVENPAVLCSGEELSFECFRKVVDPGVLAKLEAGVRDRIRVADISKVSFAWPKPNAVARESMPPLVVPDFFVDGKRMKISAWPNEGWSVIEKIVDTGSKTGDGSVWTALDGGKVQKCGEKIRGGKFTYSESRPDVWADGVKGYLHGYWRYDWRDTIIPLGSVDAMAKTITTAAPHSYGIGKSSNPAPRRWRLLNAVCEIDKPGEYAVDLDRRLLYFMPSSDFGPQSRIMIAGVDKPIVSLRNVCNFRIECINFEGGFSEAIRAEECENVELLNLRIRGFRNVGIAVNRSRRCRVSGCEVFDTGKGGIAVDGGDRKSLERGNNEIDNCLVYDFSCLRSSYSPAVKLTGVGNAIRHCEIYGGPHMAIGVSGNDNVTEYNVISNVCNASDDAAAYYKGRDPSCTGNVIRYNFWCDIGKMGGHGCASIYFDDGDCGELVYGNVFYRSCEPGGGSMGCVYSHGGYSNRVENCIFIECKRGVGSTPWTDERWRKFLASEVMRDKLADTKDKGKGVNVSSALYQERYPMFRTFFPGLPGELRMNVVRNCAFVNCPLALPGAKPDDKKPGIVIGSVETNETCVLYFSDPGFADYAHRDFSLCDGSLIYKDIPDFAKIPFDRIGRRKTARNR